MIYLDNAASSHPRPTSVVKAMRNAILHTPGNPGRGGHQASMSAAKLIWQARETLCTFLGGDDPTRFIFTAGCTSALNMAIHGLPLMGGHVITTATEHNSVLRPLYTLFSEGKIDLTVLKPDLDGFVTSKQIFSALTRRTRLVAVSHASNVTGMVQPIAEIAAMTKRNGILLLVDAAQSIGHLPIDLSKTPIDLLALPGHKGLMGPTGIGALYIRQGISLRPLIQGGTGVRSTEPLQPTDLPEGLESGTPNVPGIAGLLAGMRFVMAHEDEIAQSLQETMSYLVQELYQIKGLQVYGIPSVPVISVRFAHISPQEAAQRLDALHIACRAGLHCAPLMHQSMGTLPSGTLRLSPGFFTTRQDIQSTLQALTQISKKP